MTPETGMPREAATRTTTQEPATEAGRWFLNVLMIQARHVSLADELTEDFPRRIAAIEAEARAAALAEAEKAVAGLPDLYDHSVGLWPDPEFENEISRAMALAAIRALTAKEPK